MYRIARSVAGLRAGLEIETLAAQYGFAHAAHYANRFKAVYGKPPVDIQKLLTANAHVVLPDFPFL